jgi:hypothetical protein
VRKKYVVGVMVAGLLVGCSGGDGKVGVSEAEQAQLVEACRTTAAQPDECPQIMNTVIQEVEQSGCSYDEAAEILTVMNSDDTSDRILSRINGILRSC